MNDEAREAARRAVPFHANRGFSIIRESERRDGYAAGFEAGVAEGIRQARAVFEDYCRDFTVGDWDAIDAKFAAIKEYR